MEWNWLWLLIAPVLVAVWKAADGYEKRYPRPRLRKVLDLTARLWRRR